MTYTQCESREPHGTKVSRKDGTVRNFYAQCQRVAGHDGRHNNGSGDWDDDGNVWSWGQIRWRVNYQVSTKLRFDSGRMGLVKRPNGSTVAACPHRHRTEDAAVKCAKKMRRELWKR